MEKYLKELTIKNFQSHEDTTLTFDPGVNMITGENNAGKTVVFRAMRFLAYNKPIINISKGLLRKGKNSILVKATMSDGSWVLKEKSKDGKINKYVVYDENIAKTNSGPLELNSFGTSVPDEVSRILGMAPVSLSKTQDIEINISTQNEESFMISRSNPEIARWIYSITNIDNVRYAIDDLNRDAKKRNEQIKDSDERIKQLQYKIENFDNLKKHEDDFNILESQNIQMGNDINKLNDLTQLYNSMIQTKQLAIPIQNRIKVLNNFINSISDEQISDIENTFEKITELISLNSDIENNNIKRSKLSNDIDKLENLVNLEDVNCDENIQNLKTLIDLDISITNLDKNINKIKDIVEKTKANLSHIDDKINKIKIDLFGDENRPCCPICGSNINEDLIDHIMEELDEKSK